MKRKLWVFVSCCVLLMAMMAVERASAVETITITDMVGRQVETPSDPERIICLGPGALRLIVYVQAQSKVVGVEDMEKMNRRGRPYWLAHPELWDLPRCGPGGPASINKQPDLEAVLALSPQVIFITYMERQTADRLQRTLNIPVVVLSYGSFATFDETIYEALDIVGKILNRRTRAGEVVRLCGILAQRSGPRTQDIPDSQKPTVYVGGIGYRGAHGIGSTDKCYTPFEWTHARNSVENLKPTRGSHIFVDKEMLLKLNPDIIFVDGGGLALVAGDYKKKKSYYDALQAFSHGRVYMLLPFNWYVTNVGTALADAYAIGKILYGHRFKGYSTGPSGR